MCSKYQIILKRQLKAQGNLHNSRSSINSPVAISYARHVED